MDEAKLESLKELKKVLLSLVCSNSSRMDVNNLKRDYADQERDGRIPINKYGHKDLITFLNTECRDIFQFEGNPFNPFLVPIVPKELKSLNDLVVKQRTSLNKSYQVKRSRGIDAEAGRMGPFRPRPWSNDCYANTNGYRNSIFERNPYHNGRNSRTNYASQSCSYERNMNERSNYPNSRKYSDISYSKPEKPAPINIVESEPELPKKAETHQSTLRVNQKIIDNLKRLVDVCEEGIWSLDISRFYERKFHIDLPVSYQTVLALCRDLPDMFKVVRPNKLGDWRVFAASAVIPDCYKEGSQKFTKSIDEGSQADCDVDIFGTAALPGFGFDPSLYPPECASYGVCLPRLPPLVAGRTLDVLLIEVRDPSHFWFQLDSPQCAVALETLMDEMDKYYTSNPSALPMVRAAARIAQLCAVPYDNRYHRALVIKNVDFDTVKVRYVDYGTVCDVAASTIRMLHLDFTQLPAQGLRGRLAGAAPRCALWSLASCQAFTDHVMEKYLVAEVANVETVDKISTYELRLFERSPDFIADRLIAVNLATDPSRPNNTKKDYLLPTFDDIENGLVGPWEPPAEPEPEEEVVAVEATPDRQGGSTPSLENAFEDCTETCSPLESIYDNVSCGSVESFPKLEEHEYHLNPSSGSMEFVPNLQEKPFPINPNVQQVFIHHVSLPHGRTYENRPYSGFPPVQTISHFYPPSQHYSLPPPYPPPYQYCQDTHDYPNYMPPYNSYANSQWGTHPVPYPNFIPSPPVPLTFQSHTRPSINTVKQYSTNLREIPSPTDLMKNLSISSKPHGTSYTNASLKNNNGSPVNISKQSSPLENFITHDFQQHSNLVQIKMEDCDRPKEKSDITTYSVNDISSEEASYEDGSEPAPSSPARMLLHTLELVDIADLSGKPVEVWLHQEVPHVILQQVAQAIVPPEGVRGLIEKVQGLKSPNHLVIQDDYVVRDLIRKIAKTGTTTNRVGMSIKIICKKNFTKDEDFILLVPLDNLLYCTGGSRQNFSVDITDMMKFIISAMKKHSKADDSDEDSDDD